MRRVQTPPIRTFAVWAAGRAQHAAWLGWLAAATVGLSAQPTGPTRPPSATGAVSRPFRHYPDGKDLQGQRLSRTAAAASDALRVEGDSQLPAGFSIRADAEPMVAPAGNNRVFRFGLEYGGVPLASSSDFVAVVGGTGRLLASRLRRVPDAVDATAPVAAAATAVDTALAHARATLGVPASLVARDAVLEIWVDDARQGHLTWAVFVRSAPGGRRFERVSATPVLREQGDPNVDDRKHEQGLGVTEHPLA